MMKKNIFTVILCMGVGISAVTMTGCGKNLTQIAQQQEDDCVVVKLPEGYGARDLFDIVSSTETFITYASEGIGSGKSIYTGELADGNTVAWRPGDEQTVLYAEGKPNTVEIVHYGNELREKTPTSYEEFKEKYDE